jgi:hypothetical protein
MVMLVALLLFFVGAFIESYIFFTKKYIQNYTAPVLFVVSTLFASTTLLFVHRWEFGLLFGLISIYRAINICRLTVKRLPEKHILSAGKRSFLFLYNAQLVIFIAYLLHAAFGIYVQPNMLLIFLVIFSLVASFTIFMATILNIIKSKPLKAPALTESELPTLTVAIAARNETPMLVNCLESVLASEYPKLEIIVLDDDSQDTTAEIIKSFAQDGVRFVNWEKYDGEWLSKNRAYQTLLSQASGDLVLYMGVDVRLHEKSLKAIVEQFITSNADMMTIVPKRTKSGFIAIFVQPMRYWWELALPTFIRRRPPALSTTWIIKRKSLDAIGGFTSYKRSIVPEDHLAKYFYTMGSYDFTRTTNDMLVTTHKTFGSQWDTQVRTRYPHAHRRPETVLVQTLLLLVLVILPFTVIASSLLYSVPSLLIILSSLSAVLFIVSHIVISVITNPVAGFFAPLNFPIAVMLDIIALHVSMYKYEFSKVIWKGRDVAPKKLKVIAKLPDLEESTRGSESTH